MINLQEQLTNLKRTNGPKQYDINIDFIVNDLNKKHSQEVANLQDQYKSVLEQIKCKVYIFLLSSKCLFIFNILFSIGSTLYIVDKRTQKTSTRSSSCHTRKQ